MPSTLLKMHVHMHAYGRMHMHVHVHVVLGSCKHVHTSLGHFMLLARIPHTAAAQQLYAQVEMRLTGGHHRHTTLAPIIALCVG